MGEIGFDRHEFLHDLKLWEIQAIVDGYRNRARPMWEAARLNAFFIMSSMVDMSKAGIHSASDLITFPWEKKRKVGSEVQPTENEVERLRELMRRENAKTEGSGT